MHSNRRPVLLLLVVLSLLACGPACVSSRPVILPCQPDVSQAAASRLEEKIRPLVEEKGPEAVTLQTTSDEVTSLLTQMLEAHAGQVPLENPRVCFTPREIHVAGRFTNILPFEFEGIVVLSPHFVRGRVRIEIVRASAGSVPLPSALLRSLSNTLNDTLAEWGNGIHFRAIEVGEGQITVTAHR